MKNDMKPSFTPCCFGEALPASRLRSAITALMSASLKVVRIAAVCCAHDELRRRSCGAAAKGVCAWCGLPASAPAPARRRVAALKRRLARLAWERERGSPVQEQGSSLGRACAGAAGLSIWLSPGRRMAGGEAGGAAGAAGAAGASALSSIVPTTSPILTSVPASTAIRKVPAAGGHLRGHFVRLQGQQRLPRLHHVAVLLVPGGEQATRDRFADCGDFDFCAHAGRQSGSRAGT